MAILDGHRQSSGSEVKDGSCTNQATALENQKTNSQLTGCKSDSSEITTSMEVVVEEKNCVNITKDSSKEISGEGGISVPYISLPGSNSDLSKDGPSQIPTLMEVVLEVKNCVKETSGLENQKSSSQITGCKDDPSEIPTSKEVVLEEKNCVSITEDGSKETSAEGNISDPFILLPECASDPSEPPVNVQQNVSTAECGGTVKGETEGSSVASDSTGLVSCKSPAEVGCSGSEVKDGSCTEQATGLENQNSSSELTSYKNDPSKLPTSMEIVFEEENRVNITKDGSKDTSAEGNTNIPSILSKPSVYEMQNVWTAEFGGSVKVETNGTSVGYASNGLVASKSPPEVGCSGSEVIDGSCTEQATALENHKSCSELTSCKNNPSETPTSKELELQEENRVNITDDGSKESSAEGNTSVPSILSKPPGYVLQNVSSAECGGTVKAETKGTSVGYASNGLVASKSPAEVGCSGSEVIDGSCTEQATALEIHKSCSELTSCKNNPSETPTSMEIELQEENRVNIINDGSKESSAEGNNTSVPSILSKPPGYELQNVSSAECGGTVKVKTEGNSIGHSNGFIACESPADACNPTSMLNVSDILPPASTPRREKRKVVNVGYGFSSAEGRSENTTTTSRERKKSKYLSFPFINPGKRSKGAATSPGESEADDTKSPGSTNGRVVSPSLVKCTRKRRKSKKSETKFVDISSAKLLSQLRLLSLDCLYPLENNDFDPAETFFTRLRASLFRGLSKSEMLGNKLGNEDAEASRKKSKEKKNVKQVSGTKLDKNTKKERKKDSSESGKPATTTTVAGGLYDVRVVEVSLLPLDDKMRSDVSKRGRKRKKEDVTCAAPVETGQSAAIPDLNSTAKVGDMSRQNKRIKKEQAAAVSNLSVAKGAPGAVWSNGIKNKPISLHVCLQGSAAASTAASSNPGSSLPCPGGAVVGPVAPPATSVVTLPMGKANGYTAAGTEPPLDQMKQNLEMMTSMLEKAGDCIPTEMRSKLEGEIKILLKKVSTMVKPSSS